MIENIYRITLPNGIRCVHKRVRSNVAYCALTIGAGSRDELPDQHGVAHLIEHSLFKGTEHRRAWQVNCRLENLGGELNAFTSKEETVVHSTTLKTDYSKAVELLADVVFHSTFPENEVAREKEVIIDEINIYKDNPGDQIFDDFEELFFDGSPLAHNILGTKKSLKKLSSKDIAAFIERTYNTDHIVFSSVGNISYEQFKRVVERYFAPVAASPREFERQKPAKIAPFEKKVVKHNFQAHCILGYNAYDLYDSKRVPLALLINMLGGPSANSLLNVSLRERNALTYSVEANITSFCDSGLASIYFGAENKDVEPCLELIDKELSSIRQNGLTARRLSIAKKQYVGQLAIAFEANESYNLGLGKSILTYDSVDAPDEIHRKIMSVTNDDIREVANEIFANQSVLLYI